MDRTESLEFLERWLQVQLYLFGGQAPFPDLFGIAIVSQQRQIPGVPAVIPVPGLMKEELVRGKEPQLAFRSQPSPG